MHNLYIQIEDELQLNSKLKLNYILRRIWLSDKSLRHKVASEFPIIDEASKNQ